MGSKYDISKFKDRFKERRKAMNFTQEAFGNPPPGSRSGYYRIADRRTVSNWEKGISLPKIETAIELCDLLECDFDYLFGKINLPTKKETDLEDATGMSEKATSALLALSCGDPSDLRKLRFIESLLENEDLLDGLSTCAVNYLIHMRQFIQCPGNTVEGYSHDQLAKAEKAESQEILSKLFIAIFEKYSGETTEEWGE